VSVSRTLGVDKLPVLDIEVVVVEVAAVDGHAG